MGIWVIQNKNDYKLYWSNQFGWVEDGESIDIFSDQDVDQLQLPLHGKWMELGDRP